MFTQPVGKPPAPVDLELYVESGNVHAKIVMSHELSIYRRTDLETHGVERAGAGEPKPEHEGIV